MVDPNLLVRQYLLQNSALLAMLGSYQITAHLPEHFDPNNGPIVVVGTEGGTSHPEIPIQTQRVKVRVWAGVNGFAVARQVYGVVHDWLHGQNDLDFGDLGTILASIETDTGQDITDPDTGWATVLAFYDVTVRDGAFADLSGTFQAGSETQAYIDAGDAATLAAANAYTDAHSGGGGGDDRPYIDAGDAATLVSANAHSDAADATTLSAANAYSDTQDGVTLAAAQDYADTADQTTLAAAEAYADGIAGVSVNAPHTWTKPQTFQPDTDVPGVVFQQSGVATPVADIAQFQDQAGVVLSRVKADGSFQAGSALATINIGATGVPPDPGEPGSLYTREDGAAGTTLYVNEAGVWVPFKPAPSFADISGVATAGQLPNLPESQITNLTTDLAAKEAAANKDAASGYAGLTSGTLLKAAQFPAPGASTFGGVKSLAPVATKFLTSVGTDGIPVAAQPNFTDLASFATAAQGGTAVIDTQGRGYFWSLGMQDSSVVGTAVVISPTGANNVLVFQFVLGIRATISRIVFPKGGVNVAGATANFGLYNESKNLVIGSGQFDCAAAAAATQTSTVSAVVLNPGVYWFAQAATDSTVTCSASITTWNTSIMTVVRNQNTPANNARQGVAANALSAGALPSTLGNITAFTNRTPVAILFEP